MKKTNYDVFLETVEKIFIGCKYYHENVLREVNPTILSSSDLIRYIDEPKNPYEMYLKQLPESFKRAVRSELYRADTGWITRSKDERKVLRYTHEGQSYLVPFLSNAAVGIDTSDLSKSKIIVIAFYNNYEAAIQYFENHLRIPRSKNPVEFKWNKLDPKFRQVVHDNMDIILNISCKAVFIMNTNFINKLGKMNANIFINMIDGCFTGYNLHPVQNLHFRKELRRRLFALANNTPSHCDSDLPLRPERVVRLLVRVLSKYNDEPQPCTPLYAPLTSEESEPIQVTDLLAGVINSKISDEENPPYPFSPLFYNTKKLSKKYREEGVFVKAYYWLR